MSDGGKAAVEKALGQKVRVVIPPKLKLESMALVDLNAIVSRCGAKPFDGKKAAIDFLLKY
jgi:hypothetical protein